MYFGIFHLPRRTLEAVSCKALLGPARPWTAVPPAHVSIEQRFLAPFLGIAVISQAARSRRSMC